MCGSWCSFGGELDVSVSTTLIMPSSPAFRARITTFGNLKGGVGKTTGAINLACALARGVTDPVTGREAAPPARVLLVDLESLRTASQHLSVHTDRPEQSSGFLFRAPGSDTAERIAAMPQRAPNEPIDVIAADPDAIASADSSRESEYNFVDNLQTLAYRYDHIIIDLPGQSQGRVFRSVLIASDGVVIPVLPDPTVMQSMGPFLSAVEDIRRGANPDLRVDGWLISRAGHRNDIDAEVMQETLQQTSRYHTFQTRIRTLKAVGRAAGFRCSVFSMADGAEAMRDFRGFATEWLARIGRTQA